MLFTGALTPHHPQVNLSKAKHNSCSYHCNWVERDSAEKKNGIFSPIPSKVSPSTLEKLTVLFLFSFNEQLWPFSFEVLNDQKAIEVCWVFFSPPHI